MPPSRLRRFLRFSTRALIVSGVLLGGLYLLRNPLFGGMLRERIQTEASDALGTPITIGAVSGGWLSDLTLHDIDVPELPADGTVRRASVERIEVHYRLLDLLDDPIAGLDSIDVAGADVAIEIADDETPDVPTDELDEPVADFLRAIPDELPRGRVAGRFEFQSSRLGLACEFVAERPRPGELDIDVAEFELSSGERRFQQDELHLDIRRDAGAVSIDNGFQLGGFGVRSANLELIDDAAVLTAGLTVGGDLNVRLDKTSIHAELSQVDLSQVPIAFQTFVTEAFADVPPVVVDAEIDIGWRPPYAAVARNVSAQLDDASLRVAEVHLEDFEDLGTISWSDLTATVPDAAALATSLSRPLPPERLPTDGPVALSFRSPRASSESAVVEHLDLRTPRSHIRATGSLDLPAALPETPGVWTSTGLALEISAEIDADELERFALAEWALPDVDGMFSGSASVGGTFDAPSASGTLRAKDVTVAGQRVQRLDVDAALEGDVLRLARLDCAADFGQLTAQGAFGTRDQTVRDVVFELRIPDLTAISELTDRLPRLEGTLDASGLLEGSIGVDERIFEGDDWRERWPSGVRAEARVDASGVSLDGAALGDVTGSLRLDGPRLDVERLRIDGELGRVQASLLAHVTEQSIEVPGFAVSAPDLAALGRWLPALAQTHGAIEADGSFQRTQGEPWRDAKLGLQLRARQLSVPGADLRDVVLRVDADDGTVRLHEAHALTDWGAIAADGELGLREQAVTALLRRLDLDIDPKVLALDGELVPLRLRQPVHVEWEPDRLAVTGLDADFLGGRVRADLARGRGARLVAAAEGLDLRLLTSLASGRLSGTIELAGDPTHPEGAIAATIPELTWDGEVGRLDINARQDAQGLHIANCDVSAGRLLQLSAEGFAPFLLGEGGVSRNPDRRAVMHLEAQTTVPDEWLARFAPEGARATAATVVLDAEGPALQGKVVVRDLEWRDDDGFPAVRLEGDTTVELTATPEGSSARIESGGSGPFRVSGELDVAGPVDWRDPLGSAESLPDAPLTGSVQLDVPDIEDVASWFTIVRQVQGALHVDLQAGGTLGDPRFGGVIEATDVSVLAVDDIPPIDRGQLRATLQGRKVTIDECTVRLGYAPVAVSGTITHDAGGEPMLDLKAVGENVQVVRTKYMRVRSDVDVSITGPFSGFLLAGAARVTNAWYTKPMDPMAGGDAAESIGFQLFQVLDEPLASMRFDLDVQADHSVRIENTLLSGVISMDLRLGGTGAVPQPEGRLWCRDVSVRLPVTRLRVEAATITFPPDRPFDPTLRASAFSRVKGYDLDVQVTGGISDMRVLIAASPALSQEDALILLATGAPPAADNVGGRVGASAAAGAGTLLGEAAMDWLRGPPTAGEARLADRVEIYVGRETSESGVATVETEIEIVNGWFLRFERDRWEDFAAGVLYRVRFR